MMTHWKLAIILKAMPMIFSIPRSFTSYMLKYGMPYSFKNALEEIMSEYTLDLQFRPVDIAQSDIEQLPRAKAIKEQRGKLI